VALNADDPEDIEDVLGIRTREYPVAPDFTPRQRGGLGPETR
jgi:hypothetical protein